MTDEIENQTTTTEREIVSVRILEAPRELVWKVWTQPEHVKNWWGPDGFTNTINKMEVKPGGEWLLVMHGPDGTDYPNKIVFSEVEKPEKLVYDHGEAGKPGSFHVIVTFDDMNGRTKLKMRSIFNTKEEKDFVAEKYGAVEGMTQTLGRLYEYLINIKR